MNNITTLIRALGQCIDTLDSIKDRRVLSNEDAIEINKLILYSKEIKQNWFNYHLSMSPLNSIGDDE